MLDLRLTACAELVRPGTKVCDVGTDHAYLPCYLVKNGITSQVIAADVNERPLASAQKHITEQGLGSSIRTVLSDGLAQISEQEADDIVIAGMGGELICRIVLDCPWLRSAEKHLILQPMTQIPYLRETLCAQGYEILQEKPVFEKGHYYTVLLCRWCGRPNPADELFALIGKIPESNCPDRDGYLLYQANRLEKIAAGYRRSASVKDMAEQYQRLAEQIRRFLPNG